MAGAIAWKLSFHLQIISMHHGRVLVVDDEPLFREMVGGILRVANYEVETCAGVPEAIERLSSSSFDLMISDMEMPGNDDLHLIRTAAQMTPSMPVILMTAYPSMESAIQSVKLRVAAYLVKPFEKKDLLDQVGPSVQNYRALKALRASTGRVDSWKKALDRAEQNISNAPSPDPSSWRTLLDLTLRNAAEAIADARTFAELAGATGATAAPLEHPSQINETHPVLLLNALLETLVVIDKTRSSFKSKELADLRKRIEPLVKATWERGKEIPKA
jgi:CheY-like chemotaxis protein